MKVTLCLAMALVGGLFALPVQAAGPMLDRAVELAAVDSKASLDSICSAAYEAAKEAPNELDAVFESILSQRTTWKASETYAIMRAILMARPDLAQNLCAHVASFRKAPADEKGEVTYEASPELNAMVCRMLNVLFVASLEEGVAENALNNLVCVYCGVYENAVNAAHNNINVNTNMVDGVYRIDGLIATPPSISPNN